MKDEVQQSATQPQDGHVGPWAEARVQQRRWFSWVWLAPVAALALLGYLIFTVAENHGPKIWITFETADGLVAGVTNVKYKAVTLGTVESIELSDDHSHVVVGVRMKDRAESLLTQSARFWVVRPRFSEGLGAFKTGLQTLVSGAYVAIDPGAKSAAPQTHFEGLEKPPSVRSDEPGTTYFLLAESLGGLGGGSPVFYRDIEVGEVLSYELKEGGSVKLRVFVRSPYDRRVLASTRFWNASGLKVTTGADGLRVEIESARTLLSGGIEFQTPGGQTENTQHEPGASFKLYPSRAAAEVGFFGPGVECASYFQTSVRGLSSGSEVHMFGTRLGAVTNVELARDPRPGHEGQLATRVSYVLQPQRAFGNGDRELLGRAGIAKLVDDQVRVVLRTSNLITGEQVLSLEYVPDGEASSVLREGNALILPSSSQDLGEVSRSLSQIADRINSIPFRSIGQNLNRTLVAIERTVGGPEMQSALVGLDQTLDELHKLAREANAGMTPALRRLPAISKKLEQAVEHADEAFGRNGYGSDSTVQRNFERMMDEIALAARRVRLLADYLARHPDHVLLGRDVEDP